MNKYILFFYFALFSAISNAQQYHTFPLKNATWIYERKFGHSTYSYHPVLDVRWQIRKSVFYFNDSSTTINGIKYNELVSNNMVTYYQEESSAYWDTQLTVSGPYPFINIHEGFLRQDTANKKIYFAAQFTDSIGIHYYEDKLLYDYSKNLVVGDTLPYTYQNNYSPYFGIVAVDSLPSYLGYLKCYKLGRFVNDTLLNLIYPISIIEGIGSTVDLLSFLYESTEDYYSKLVCFSRDGHNVYPDSLTECSWETVGITELQKVENFNIYPNPTKDRLYFTTNSLVNKNATLQLINILGDEIYKSNITSTQTEIDVQQFAKGLYFLKYKNGKESKISKIFIE